MYRAPHELPIGAQAAQIQSDAFIGFCPCEKEPDHSSAQQLRQRRCDRDSRNAHPEADDEQNIKRDIDKAARDQKVQRPL